MKSKAQAGLVEDSSGTNLLRRERRNKAFVAEAGQGFDIIWVPPDCVRNVTDSSSDIDLLGVYARIVAGLKVEHTRSDPLLLALARLSLTIEVPYGLSQELCNVRVLLLQHIPDLVAAHQITLTSFERLGNA